MAGASAQAGQGAAGKALLPSGLSDLGARTSGMMPRPDVPDPLATETPDSGSSAQGEDTWEAGGACDRMPGCRIGMSPLDDHSAREVVR